MTGTVRRQVVSAPELTLYHLDHKRGAVAMDTMGIIGHLAGVLVHDGWAPYRSYDNVTHAQCNAHHVRELQAVAETTAQASATEMTELLCDTWTLVLDDKQQQHTALDTEPLDTIRTRYRTIITAGHTANRPHPALHEPC